MSATVKEPRPGRRLSVADCITLVAVGVVVVLVSLPRLQVFAMRENETDAMGLLRLLGSRELAADARAPHRIADLDLSDPALQRRLRSLEVLADGRLFERYGYLFDLTGEGGDRSLRAWPRQWGETGRRAFVLGPGGGLWSHPNDDGRWEGRDQPPRGSWSEAEGWRPVPLDADYR